MLLLGLIASLSVSSVRADTVTVSLGELNDALEQASSNPDAVSQLILDEVALKLQEADFQFDAGTLVYTESAENVTVEEGCNRTIVLRMQTDVRVLQDTALSLTLDSLFDPIVVALDLVADVSAIGRARQILGIRLGQCQDLAQDTFDFTALGALDASLSVTLELNPEWTAESTLSFFPSFSLEGSVNSFSPTVNVDDTVFSRLLEDYLEDELNDAFSSSSLGEALAELQDSLELELDESLENGRIDIQLPPADDAQILALYQLLQPTSRFPLTLDMLYENRQLILAALILGETGAVEKIFQDALICQASDALRVELDIMNVYSNSSGSCAAIDLETLNQSEEESLETFYSDAQCTRSFPYSSITPSSFCSVALDTQRLGNPASRPHEIGRWMLSEGSTFDIGARSIVGLQQPFVRREMYKSVETQRGTCELEMRVYSTDPTAKNNKALIAFHGGSWAARGSGILGIEATATHFANRGFTVFAPFYRLVGEADAVAACNTSSLQAIVADSNSALDWVLQNGDQYGASGKPVLFGQSAGGHLALTLATGRPEVVNRSVLFYSPSDFADFIDQINNGDYQNPVGNRILEEITGASLSELSSTSPIVVENSFPQMIVNDPTNFPPVFLMHGEFDTLLPFRQSSRLCNAYAGEADLNSGPASTTHNLDSLKTEVSCGSNGSFLHLIAEGEHALDLCIAEGLCLSGSSQSANEVSISLGQMLDWVSVDNPAPFNDDEPGLSTSGGLSLWMLLCATFFSLIRVLRSSRWHDHWSVKATDC